ncbi:hypothetical protein V6N13_124851 [Hibiscus sabdariffa]|uniref:Uncharacterized protein n=1 Tax=Hibiscus sabdariffa TaxID=183260 RepID=A0ABR2U442_9ROSI
MPPRQETKATPSIVVEGQTDGGTNAKDKQLPYPPPIPHVGRGVGGVPQAPQAAQFGDFAPFVQAMACNTPFPGRDKGASHYQNM